MTESVGQHKFGVAGKNVAIAPLYRANIGDRLRSRLIRYCIVLNADVGSWLEIVLESTALFERTQQ